MTLTKNKYYFEALDNFPHALSDCLDSLNYALSYDPEDADSLCLMGRVYSEILKDYETAKKYFEEAMQSHVSNINTPRYYIECLLNNEDYDEAGKLIEFALQIKGIDKAEILYCKAHLLERKEEFKAALEQLKESKRFSYCRNMFEMAEDKEKFIKDKMPRISTKRKVETE
ncbi:MAG: hypothetical protein MUW56_09105 [Chryseobacterium sp.]|uniref:tetratricopeptide repeat protein n=1 Tax=Chryseobacterium sp. TaxID=1871047 RepID=UPI0025C54BF7|nr:hypothetical protein [Chryseobacterium sp.]MCJ7933776.1 hypothetical protein [Chryseobacterium sp.]